jgi:hypothetical protein
MNKKNIGAIRIANGDVRRPKPNKMPANKYFSLEYRYKLSNPKDGTSIRYSTWQVNLNIPLATE